MFNNKNILEIGKSFKLGLYEKAMPNTLSLEEKLTEAKSVSFDFLEMSIDESPEKMDRLKWPLKKRKDLVDSMWKTGVRILTICLSANRKYPIGSENESIRNRGVEIMIDAINLAQDIGVRIIQIAGYDEYYLPSTENTRKYFLENLEILVGYASSKGVVLAFETMETEFMNTVVKAMDFIKKINSPYLQIYPDIGNITNSALTYGTSVGEDLETGRGRIVAMHMKETIPGKFRDIPYGMGHVDFRDAFDIVSDMGVNFFVAELWHTGNDDWREQIREANKFLQSNMIILEGRS